MSIHDQAAKLGQDVGDVPDPEDSIDYDGLKASVARIARLSRDLQNASAVCRVISVQRQATELAGYLTDVCFVHDVDIPEQSE